MGLSTHVLDTMHGCPAAGMGVSFFAVDAAGAHLQLQFTLTADGRNPTGPLLADAHMQVGRYRLVFEVASYFRSKGIVLPEPAFLEDVSIDFGIANASAHYHVPLLCTPWSYSTYRGS